MFLGKASDKRHWAYGMHNNIPEGPAYPIRSIQDKRYKLIVNLTPDSTYHEKHMMAEGNNRWQSWIVSARTDPYAKWLVARFVKRPAIEFYDHETAPWELNNLADDPAYSERITTMQRELYRWMEEQGDKGVLMDTQNPEQTIQNIRQPVSHYGRGAGGMHDQYGSGLYDMQGRLLSTARLSGLYIAGGESRHKMTFAHTI